MSGNAIQSSDPNAHKVLCAGAMSAIIGELAAAFEQTTGQGVTIEIDRSGVVRDRVRNGEQADVAITTGAAIAALAAEKRVIPETAAVVARSAIGVAIRAGAAKPDIGSIDGFKRMLLSVKSIAYADPATGSPSGNHFVKVLDRLGIAADVAQRAKVIGAGHGSSVVVVCDAVASGTAEIGIQQIAEILPVAGVELAGPLPDELQQLTEFSVAVLVCSGDAAAARRFVDFITSPSAGRVVSAHGMEPA
jgi:molybdate transport system substrate-binding protein